ncbi:hypothetical protein AQUCO_01600102v1 [Aquilegia coerulea]|uniref:Uncharacterized protein n=1 Tax=Aquilegia coerulea TaxID=218851 RepID=A0A2G5DQC4_AQUCA|nr:hypothetical protein AQUCO_01600102v1 [Aquilegia coerulea]
MVYTYTPAYYSSLHDTITSLCKNILPFSFKKRGLPAAEQKLSKQQSENLKWQQESFHRILNLIGLHKEGMVPEKDVLAFRSHVLDTLIASPADQEQPTVIRDKLLFLQELLYAKCISVDEYHSSKRPLLQRLAVQGAEIEATDVIVAGQVTENSEEEWSNIDFKDEETLMDKESLDSNKKSKHRSPMKRIKGAASLIHFTKNKAKKGMPNSDPLRPLDPNIHSNANEPGIFKENPFWGVPMKTKESEAGSILMPESTLLEPVKAEKERGSTEKVKKKPFRALFHKEGKGGENLPDLEVKKEKSTKKQWGFDGLKKWKKNDSEDEVAPLPLGERSDDPSAPCNLVSSPMGEGPDTKHIKEKIHSNGAASDFFIDKVLGENIKKELSRIQTELCTKNSNLQFSNDQIEAISTRLPVDKADLKKFFPKSWCDRYGDIVLDVVKKEFKDHVGEMENMRQATKEKRQSSARWVSFEDNDENCHPNLFTHQDLTSNDHDVRSFKCFDPQSFLSDSHGEKLRSESTFSHDYNPFWSPKAGSPMMN